MKNKIFSCLLVSLFLFSIQAQARWADPKEASYAVNFENMHVKIKKDGTYVITMESQLEILKDNARDKGLWRYNFDAGSSKFRIIDARTINKDKTIPVLRKDIEIKPLASNGAGFGRSTQVTMPYREVNVGSKLYVKYERQAFRTEIPGIYTDMYTVGLREYVQKFSYTYESEVPLYYEVFNPGFKVDVTAEEKKVVFRSQEPIFRQIAEEENALFKNDTLFWLAVSTLKDWKDFPKKMITRWEDTIQAPLPKKYETIIAAAQKKTAVTDQINTVTSLLADEVRYVGDWRTVDGAYFPRSLATIAKSGYGDCKDFTVSTAAMLRKLGFETHAVWITRGKDIIFSPLKNVAALEANHAIVYAKKDGKEFWIDPTNTVSFAQGLFEDIEGRPALVFFPSGLEKRMIPPMQASMSDIRILMDLDFSKPGIVDGKGQFSLRGSAATGMAGSELSQDKKSIDYTLITWATSRNRLLSWDLEPYDLKSRVVADLNTGFKFQEPWLPVITSMGPGYAMPVLSYVSYLWTPAKDRVALLNMPFPTSYSLEYLIRGRDVNFSKELDCKGSSEWLDYSRRMFKKDGAVSVVDNLTLKVKTITPEVLQSSKFVEFQEKVAACLQAAVVVFK